jgi:hypothetical protein
MKLEELRKKRHDATLVRLHNIGVNATDGWLITYQDQGEFEVGHPELDTAIIVKLRQDDLCYRWHDKEYGGVIWIKLDTWQQLLDALEA